MASRALGGRTSVPGRSAVFRSDSRLNALALYAVCAWFSVPSVSAALGLTGCLMVLALWAVTTRYSVLLAAIVHCFSFVYWWAYMLLLMGLGVWWYGDIQASYFLASTALFGVGAIILRYYQLNRNGALLIRASVVTLFGWLGGATVSILWLQTYPMASRELATGRPSEVDYAALGVGGFGYVYATVLVLNAFVYLVRTHVYSGLVRSALGSLLGACVVFTLIVSAEYATALISASLLLVVGLVLPRSRRGRWAGVLMMALAILLGFPRVGVWISSLGRSLSEDSIVAGKFLDLGAALTGGDGGQTSNRLELYSVSMNAFFDSPFVGQSSTSSPVDLGWHSAWLDLLGAFGLVGAIPLFLFIAHQCITQLRETGSSIARGMITLAYFYIFALGFVNPVIYLPHIGFVLFFLTGAVSHLAPLDEGSSGSSALSSPGSSVLHRLP